MEISKVDLYRYELPLTTPLQLGTSTVKHRRGLLLRVGTEQGTAGWGDAPPLPGFSDESLSDVVAWACEVAPRWIGMEIPNGTEALDRSLAAFSLDSACPASLRFAVEGAITELLAALRGTSMAAVLGTPRPTVALNALLMCLDEGAAEAARYWEQGYRALKVKVGREEMEKEVDALRKIRRELGDGMALRADANRAWSLDEAVAFAEATRDVDLAYVEEPLADPARLSDLTAQTGVPIALDETTREVEPEILRNGPPVSAVILKPTLLGGLRKTQAWSRIAQENGAAPVISAAYESGIGLRMLVALAAVGPDIPVGLSTYDRLAADVLCPPLSMTGPTIEVGSVVDSEASIDEECLIPIDTFSA